MIQAAVPPDQLGEHIPASLLHFCREGTGFALRAVAFNPLGAEKGGEGKHGLESYVVLNT